MTKLTPRGIADELRQRAKAGDLPAGMKLPNAEDLGAWLREQLADQTIEVSASAATRAYEHLKGFGVVETARGHGTFIRDLSGRDKFTLQLEMDNDDELGYRPRVSDPQGVAVNFDHIEHSGVRPLPAPSDIAYLLSVPAMATSTVHEGILGWKRGRPESPHRNQKLASYISYLPPWLASELPIIAEPGLGLGGVHRLIEEHLGQPVRWSVKITTETATDEAAERLALSRPAELLRLRLIAIDHHGRVVEVLDQRYDGNKFEVSSDLPGASHAQ